MSTAIVLKQVGTLATKMGLDVEARELVDVLKATAFRGEVTDAQMSALLVVANQYALNPWTKEIYAFPDKKNGIIPVVGVDGWSRIINDHPQFDGMEFRQSEKTVRMDGAKVDAPEWMECIMFRKDRSHPVVIREYLDEVYRQPFKNASGYTNDGPWQTHTKRFLRHKTMIQCARLAFGYSGIYDEDEAERIRDMGNADVVGSRPLSSDASSNTSVESQTVEVILPEYNNDALNADAPKVAKAILAKRVTLDAAITTIKTKFTISEVWEKNLRSRVEAELKKLETPAENPTPDHTDFVEAMGEE